MSRYSNLFFLFVTKLLSVSIMMHHGTMFVVEGAMARLTFATECSASDIDKVNEILEIVRTYMENPDVRRHRNLRHLDNIENSIGGNDKGKRELINSYLKKLQEPLPLSASNVTYVHNNTTIKVNGPVGNVTAASSRELFPAFCNDLCAGYVPRRCTVTRCVGYRRQRQLQTIVQTPPDQTGIADPCYNTISFANMLLGMEGNGFTSNCVASRSWYCMSMC